MSILYQMYAKANTARSAAKGKACTVRVAAEMAGTVVGTMVGAGVGQKPPVGQLRRAKAKQHVSSVAMTVCAQTRAAFAYSAHSVAPATSETVPAGQTVQLVLAWATLKVPGEHCASHRFTAWIGAGQ